MLVKGAVTRIVVKYLELLEDRADKAPLLSGRVGRAKKHLSGWLKGAKRSIANIDKWMQKWAEDRVTLSVNPCLQLSKNCRLERQRPSEEEALTPREARMLVLKAYWTKLISKNKNKGVTSYGEHSFDLTRKYVRDWMEVSHQEVAIPKVLLHIRTGNYQFGPQMVHSVGLPNVCRPSSPGGRALCPSCNQWVRYGGETLQHMILQCTAWDKYRANYLQSSITEATTLMRANTNTDGAFTRKDQSVLDAKIAILVVGGVVEASGTVPQKLFLPNWTKHRIREGKKAKVVKGPFHDRKPLATKFRKQNKSNPTSKIIPNSINVIRFLRAVGKQRPARINYCIQNNPIN